MLSSLLVDCDKGWMRDADSGDCIVCPKGTFSETIDADSCTSCPGQITFEEGFTMASQCFGKYIFS